MFPVVVRGNTMGTLSCSTLLLLLLVIRGSIQKSDPTSLKYRAAVVELQSVDYTNDAVKTLNDNAEKIVSFITQAAERDVDIVVFPELGLTSLTIGNRHDLVSRSTLVPDPSQNYAPCTDSGIPVNEAFKKVACSVERNDIYVVVNLLERELCTMEDCPSDGISVYITSVVFDRNGLIIARARKFHLVNEYDVLNVMKTPELSTFDTDFGVTFGHLVCFDIMFEDTMLALTRKLNITDVIQSAGWISEMPSLTTIQMQAGWAFAEDINLLASGHNDISSGHSGSGIYAGRQGVVAAVLPLEDHEELLIADVRKKSKKTVLTGTAENDDEHELRFTNTSPEHHVREKVCRKRDCGSFKWRYAKYDGYETKVIAEDGLTVGRLSHMGIDCEFQVNITNLSASGVTYRLLALDGVRSFGGVESLGTRICAIVFCANDTIDSCGHIRTNSVVFDSIKVTVNGVDNARTIMMPNTLASDDMLPFKNWTWDQYRQNGRIYTSISKTTPTENLATFGFWGRNFEKDAQGTRSS